MIDNVIGGAHGFAHIGSVALRSCAAMATAGVCRRMCRRMQCVRRTVAARS